MPSGRYFAGSKVDLGTGSTVIITGTAMPLIYTDQAAITTSAKGVVFIAVQTGSNVTRAPLVTTTGALQSFIVNTPTVTVSTGTISISGTSNFIMVSGTVSTGVVSISGTSDVTIVNSPNIGTVSTILAMPVLSATNITVASMTTGTVSLSGTSNFILVSGTVSTVIAMPIVVVTASANPIVITGTVAAAFAPSGTQDVNVINSPIAVTGTLDASFSPSGTQDVNVVNTANFILVSGTVSTVLAMPTIVVTASANPIVITGTVTSAFAPSGTQDVSIVNTANFILVSGTVSTVLAMPVLSATNITVASMTTGTVSISGTSNFILISGTVSTVLAMPVLSATNVTIASITTGTVTISSGGLGIVATVSTIGTLLGTIAVSGTVTGVPVYVPAAAIASGTGLGGPMFIGVQSGATLGRAVLLTTTGALTGVVISNITTGTVSISSGGLGIVATVSTVGTLLGTVAVSGTVTGVPVYVPVAAIASGTGLGGPMFIGVQSGATLGRAILLTTTGSPYVTVATNLGVITVTGIVSRTVAATRWQAYVVATTSAAAGVIIKTSGAHTLYLTDIIVSVTGPTNVQLCSETTAFAQLYLATQGGAVMNFQEPLVCTTAQSFRAVLSSSGAAAISVIGYTVT